MGEWDVIEASKPATAPAADDWTVADKAPQDEWTPVSSSQAQDSEWSPAPEGGTKLLFGPQSRLVSAAERAIAATKAALGNLFSPITKPISEAKTPLGRVAAAGVGVGEFATRPFMQPIPGLTNMAEATKKLQPQSELDAAAEEAGRSGGLTPGNFPYGKFAKRVGSEALAGLIPTRPVDLAMYAMPWILKGGSVAEMPSAIKQIEGPKTPARGPVVDTTATPVPPGDPVEQVASRIVRQYRGTPESYTLGNLYQDTLNRFHGIEKIAEMAKKGDIKIPEGMDPGLLARSYLGLAGKVDTVLEHKMFRMSPEGNITFTGPGLDEAIAPMKASLPDLDNYLAARRTINYAGRDFETGIPLDAAQKTISILEQKYPQLKVAAEGAIQTWQDGLLQYLMDSGRIGKRGYEAIKEANDFYAPMQRVFEEDPLKFSLKNKQIFNRVTSPIKSVEGGTRKIISPLEGMVKNAFSIMDAADRNRVARSVLELRTKNPALRDVLQVVKSPGKDTITAYVGGVPVHFKAPQILREAMNGLNPLASNWMKRFLQYPMQVFRAGVTLNPEFALRNVVRDQWSAMVNSKYGFRPGYDTIRGAFSIANADDSFWRWQASGGAQSFLVSMDRTASDLLHAPPKGYWDQYGSYIKNPLKVFQDFSEGLEKPTRVGVFKRSSEKGASDIRAGFESREATTDFARIGAGMASLAIPSLYAFFNARLQGTDKVIRTLKDNPVKATLLASPLAIASAALYMLNRSEPDWAEVPQWQKDLFWLKKVKGQWVRIPKGDLGVMFGTSTEKVLEYLDKNEPGKMASFAVDLMNNLSPIDFQGGGYIPNLVRPTVENIANHNFFLKRSIVSEGKQRLLPEYQFSQYDTETAKLIGRVLNTSPAKVSNFILGHGGGMGRLALEASDKLGEMAGALPKRPDMPSEPSDVPGVRGFVVREPSGSSSQSVNDFYGNWEAIQQTMNSLKQHPQDFNKINDAHPEWVLYKSYQKTADILSKYRKIRDGILNSDAVAPAKKKEAIDKLNGQMTHLARTAEDQLYEFRKSRRKP
jgi:hypothetical protein